ncbi:MAG: acetyl-CoA acetyltransferase [Actinomycetota bacterium]|nr:acetyl-CoA acetyltransferase [Actinomycetota bacterium]
MSVSERRPCIIGVAQHTVPPGQGPAPEPLELWASVCAAAAADTGGRGVLGAVESLQVVYCQSWQYDDPPLRLAQRLGIEPTHRHYSGVGGTTPQLLVQTAAERILRGELDLALVTGAEALETRRQLRKTGARPEWSFPEPQRSPFPFEAPFHPAEVTHEVFQAWLTFALFDIARRARLGAEPEAHRRAIGTLLAPMTEVAAANPYAWFPRRRSAEELITATATNRMVGYPYTKYTVSIMDVDMAGAVLVASAAKADELGVPADRRVHLRGWCYGTDPVYVAERETLGESPAMRAVGAEALAGAGAGIDDVAHLDLYSCFASSVQFARDALGLGEDDGRPVTVTGGLPFAGGAGSNYMTHSIATMTEVLRDDPGSLGLVSGVGMHMTKHAYALYGTEPGPVCPPDPEVQARLDALPTRSIRDEAKGPATMAAYSVVHARNGGPEWGLAVCDLPRGDRCYAKVLDADLLTDLERREWVGAPVELVSGGGGVNLAQVTPP